MSNLIGEGEPSGARGKFLFGLFNLCLVTAVGLHAIMKLEHDMVVFRPPALSYMQKFKRNAETVTAAESKARNGRPLVRTDRLCAKHGSDR